MSAPWAGLDRGLHEEAGAVFGVVGDREVPRHYGDPALEYRAATDGVAVADRSDRARLLVSGRAPARMLDGILTCAIPGGATPAGARAWAGAASYSAVLTPKGRMITDLRVVRLDRAAPGEPGDGGGGAPAGDAPASPFSAPAELPVRADGERFLLDVPPAALGGLERHLGRFLPPRFAVAENVADATGMLTVMGPEAAELLAREALGLRVESADLEALAEGEYREVDTGAETSLHAIRNGDVATPAWDVLADRATVAALWRRLREAGAAPVGYGVMQTLRVERGRPAFGVEMTEKTIPVEAGIHDRAIDYAKGCYTGQEVIVRIRDRGRVNRHLRGLRLGDAPSPAPGTELFAPEARGERSAGVVTSAVRSPRRGETLALAYVRREVEPGGTVRVGDAEGPEGVVVELEGAEWREEANP